MKKIWEDLCTQNKRYIDNFTALENDSKEKLHLSCKTYVKNEPKIDMLKSLYLKLTNSYN